VFGADFASTKGRTFVRYQKDSQTQGQKNNKSGAALGGVGRFADRRINALQAEAAQEEGVRPGSLDDRVFRKLSTMANKWGLKDMPIHQWARLFWQFVHEHERRNPDDKLRAEQCNGWPLLPCTLDDGRLVKTVLVQCKENEQRFVACGNGRTGRTQQAAIAPATLHRAESIRDMSSDVAEALEVATQLGVPILDQTSEFANTVPGRFAVAADHDSVLDGMQLLAILATCTTSLGRSGMMRPKKEEGMVKAFLGASGLVRLAKVGSTVTTAFGDGELVEVRADGVRVIQLQQHKQRDRHTDWLEVDQQYLDWDGLKPADKDILLKLFNGIRASDLAMSAGTLKSFPIFEVCGEARVFKPIRREMEAEKRVKIAPLQRAVTIADEEDGMTVLKNSSHTTSLYKNLAFEEYTIEDYYKFAVFPEHKWEKYSPEEQLRHMDECREHVRLLDSTIDDSWTDEDCDAVRGRLDRFILQLRQIRFIAPPDREGVNWRACDFYDPTHGLFRSCMKDLLLPKPLFERGEDWVVFLRRLGMVQEVNQESLIRIAKVVEQTGDSERAVALWSHLNKHAASGKESILGMFSSAAAYTPYGL
jgi:hypothetical protein